MIEFTLHHTIESAIKGAAEKAGRTDPVLEAMILLYVEEQVTEWIETNCRPITSPEQVETSTPACRCGEPGVGPYQCEADDCEWVFPELNPIPTTSDTDPKED